MRQTTGTRKSLVEKIIKDICGTAKARCWHLGCHANNGISGLSVPEHVKTQADHSEY